MSDQSAPKGAFIQRDKETYAIVPRTPVGVVTPELLENIASVAKKYEIPIIKITSGQRIALVGMKPEIVESVWEELGTDIGPAVGKCFHYVQACPGTAVCKNGILDSLGLGMRLEQLLVGAELPAKGKIGVSGCGLCCAESFVRDFGVFAKRTGWTFIIGGNSGRNARIGDVIAEDFTDDQVVELTNKCVEYYRANAKPNERTARFVQRIGIEEIKKAVLE
ncbi:NAD(P)/FAD-dependent oxidoreductase [Desulfosporosinus sp. BG]|uniref:NAD(P)/FAD-dependent oxidoreductase n=1 Tax=Desulfosporosinus sp. BG TaxID=1633135 RepID=UPI00083A1CD8|nr:NAD(P)/FAD-dependent oxidoreductase [Desulfosporosinus sp. BG]ODA39028.1 Nitrite/sulfite reductase subunit [Desulfosporosinus sp. BG]